MKWTNTKPTAAGWYWCHGNGRKRVVELRDDGYGLYIVQTGKLMVEVEDDEYAWAGPIPEPEA